MGKESSYNSSVEIARELASLQTDISANLEKQRIAYADMDKRTLKARDLKQEMVDLSMREVELGEAVNKLTKSNADLLKKLQKTQEKFNENIDDMAASMTGFTDRIPLVGKSMSKYVTEGAKAAKKSFASFTKSGMSGFRALTATMMANPIFAIAAIIIGIIVLLVKLIAMGEKFNQEVKGLRKEFGLSADNAAEMNKVLHKGVSDGLYEKIKESVSTLRSELGYLPNITLDFQKQIKTSVKLLGLSTEAAGKLLAFTTQNGMSLSKYRSTLEDVISDQNKHNKLQVSGREITSKIANIGTDIRIMYKGQTDELVKQVAATTRLGISMSKARDIAKGMLDIESSIEAQFEAQVLTGKQLNFDEARRLQLAGKFGDAAELIRNQVGDISKMDLIQQDAIAAATGMSIAELAGSQLKSEASGQAAVAAGLESVATGMDNAKEAIASQLAGIGQAISQRVAPGVEALARTFTSWTGLGSTTGKNEAGENVTAEYDKTGFVQRTLATIMKYTAPGGMAMSAQIALAGMDISDNASEKQARSEAGMVDDFIMRPGKQPIKFRKDDILLGGTKLFDGPSGSGGDASSAIVARLDRLIGLVMEGKTIELDGTKIAETLALNKLDIGVG